MTVAGAITPEALYLASAALALFTALETPTRNSIVPNLVPREDVASAMALNSTQRQLGNIVGPPVAGILIAFSGPAWCYLVDTLSWLAMLGALVLVRTTTQATASGRGRPGLRSIADGIVFVRDNPILLYMMLLDFGANLFGNNRALFPMYARDILGVGAPGLGLMFTATAVGAIISGAVMSLLPPMKRAGVWVLAGIGFYAVCLCVFAVSPYFWLSLLMLAGTGVGNSVSTVLRMTITQLSTPDHLRGRVSAVNGLFTQGGPQLGQFQTGAIAEFAGPVAACLFGGLATLAIAVGAYASPRIRSYTNPAMTERAGGAPARS
jgi:MFS family permease